MRMTMTGAGHRVSAVEIEKSLTFASVDPDTFAAFSRDTHLFVGRELIKIFKICDVVEVRRRHWFILLLLHPGSVFRELPAQAADRPRSQCRITFLPTFRSSSSL